MAALVAGRVAVVLVALVVGRGAVALVLLTVLVVGQSALLALMAGQAG